MARVKIDNTGTYLSMPVILYEREGELTALEPLVRYFVVHALSKSRSWMIKVCQAVSLLLDYMEANKNCFNKPAPLFDSFAKAVSVGTINAGNDPSGLYWLPRLAKGARDYLLPLSAFSDWMAEQQISTPLNPWERATAYEQRLRWAAIIHKNERSFLGHLGSHAGLDETAMQARATKLRKVQSATSESAKTFPMNFEMALLRDGFLVPGKEHSNDLVERFDWRAICITLLLLGGGRRVSEPFHLWVCDVGENPTRPGEALVRFYHPIDGSAPGDFNGPNNRPYPNRHAYLHARYPGYVPRNLGSGNYFAGWKGLRLDSKQGNYFQVKWLPSEYGQLFLSAFHMYMQKRLRLRILADKHPFLFVSTHPRSFGEPYTIDAFEAAWSRAMKRIGLSVTKMAGTSTHGPRHGYGKKARLGGVSRQGLKSGLGHVSDESQDVYGQPGIVDVTNEMDAASERINILSSMREAALERRESTNANLDFESIWGESNGKKSGY